MGFWIVYSKKEREKLQMQGMRKNAKWKMVLPAALILVLMFAFAAFGAEEAAAEYVPAAYGTMWALLPPVVAIGLALITKEVYSSLFVGILDRKSVV